MDELPVQTTGRIGRWLSSAPSAILYSYAIAASFGTYFCMYAFRKPFSAASYQDALTGEPLYLDGASIRLKTALVLSQIAGYALSKFLGIKICSEVTRRRRAWSLVLLIVLAELALVLFAVVPPRWKLVAIFCNGLPLGMVWGMVVWYLEGRRASEFLLAGLSCSFIVSSATVKDVGLFVMDSWGVSEPVMPMVTGLLFLGPFLFFVWMLDQLPEPDASDVAERCHREPMDSRRRFAFFGHFLTGMLLLLAVYFFVTAYRDYRDNYGIEIVVQLGLRDVPGETPATRTDQMDPEAARRHVSHIFTRTETPVAFGVLVALSLLSLVRNNRWGLLGMFALMTAGSALTGISTYLFRQYAMMDALVWVSLVGLGTYLTYVPFGSMLFDRVIASTRSIGTAVFGIYVMDAVGYVGSIGVQIYDDFVSPNSTRLEFFIALTYFVSILSTVCLVVSCVYFLFHSRLNNTSPDEWRA